MPLNGPSNYLPLVAAVAKLDQVNADLDTARKELDELERLTHSLGIANSGEKVDWAKVDKAEKSERLLLRKISLLEAELSTARADLPIQQDEALKDFQVRADEAKNLALTALPGIFKELIGALEGYLGLVDEIKAMATELTPVPKWVRVASYFTGNSFPMPTSFKQVVDDLKSIENSLNWVKPAERRRVKGPDGKWGLETITTDP